MNTGQVEITGLGARVLALLPVALVVLPFWGAASWGGAQGRTDLIAAFVVVGVFMVLLFLVLASVAGPVVFRSSKGTASTGWASGWMRLTIGDDGRFSTSKMMVVLWTLVFAAALTFLSVMVWFGHLTQDQAFGQEWSPYLLLLGGPFAAAVLAKSITSSKSSGGEKSTASETSLGAVASNDAGTLSLPDTQYSIFTLVAIVYFVGAFLARIRAYAIRTADCVADPAAAGCTVALPEIPAALLGLTSLAALTYVGAKAVTTEVARILSVLPENVRASAKDLVVKLINAPQGLRQEQVIVKFTLSSDKNIQYLQTPNSAVTTLGAVATFTVEAPPDPGTYDVVVSLPSAETAPHSETVI